MKRNLKVHSFEQGTEEWLQIRIGKMTGSKASLLLTKGTDSLGLGVGMVTFLYQKLGEIVTGVSGDNFKGNEDTDRGTALEPIARKAYEDNADGFVVVEEVGFCQLNEYVGCSPDGLVGTEGSIEIKCPNAANFAKYIDTRKIDKAYMAQMQFNMFVTGAVWCDFIVFHPKFGKHALQVKRIEKDDKMHELFETKLNIFESEMVRLIAKYK